MKRTDDTGRVSLWGLLGAVAGFALVLWYGVWMELHTMAFDDEFYNMLNGRDWYNVPFAPLSAWLTGIYEGLVGNRLVPFRMLALGSCVVSTLIAGWYFRHATGRTVAALAVTDVSLLLAFCLRDGDWYFFGWNTFAYPLATSLIVVMLCLFERPTPGKAALVGILAALLALVRMPSTLLMAFFPLLVLLNRPAHPWKLLGITFGSALAVGACGMVAMYGTPGAWLDAVHNNVLTDHDLGTMMEDYMGYGVTAAVYIGTFYAIFKLMEYVCTLRNGRYWGMLLVFVVFYCLFAQMRLLDKHDNYQYFVSYAIGAMPLFAVMWMYPGTWRRGPSFAMLLVLIFSGATCIGSNVGLSKMLTFTVMPIVMVWFLPKMNRGRYYATLAIFAAYILFSWRVNERNAPMHTRLWESTEYCNVPALTGVKMPERNVKMFEDQYYSFMPYIEGGYTYYVVGNQHPRFYREYLFNTRNQYLRHTWGLWKNYDDADYVEFISNWLDTAPRPCAVFYCIDCAADTLSSMSQMLEGRMREADSGKWHRIYVDE